MEKTKQDKMIPTVKEKIVITLLGLMVMGMVIVSALSGWAWQSIAFTIGWAVVFIIYLYKGVKGKK